jgi:hypothetical protein
MGRVRQIDHAACIAEIGTAASRIEVAAVFGELRAQAAHFRRERRVFSPMPFPIKVGVAQNVIAARPVIYVVPSQD